jgi:hypothetical protein
VFTLGGKTVGGTTYYGIVLNEFANYQVTGTFFFNTTPSSGIVYGIEDPDFGNTGFIAAPLSLADINVTNSTANAGVFRSDLVVFDGPTYSNTIPSDPLVFKVHNYGSSSITGFVNVTAVLLPGTTATALL